MKKLVNIYNSDGDDKINNLLENGFKIIAVDSGIYTLEFKELKPRPIKSNMTTELALDTVKADRAMKLLGETAARLKDKYPHVRIEFDDIRDVPKVWIDGERDYGFMINHTISILNIDQTTVYGTSNGNIRNKTLYNG